MRLTALPSVFVSYLLLTTSTQAIQQKLKQRGAATYQNGSDKLAKRETHSSPEGQHLDNRDDDAGRSGSLASGGGEPAGGGVVRTVTDAIPTGGREQQRVPFQGSSVSVSGSTTVLASTSTTVYRGASPRAVAATSNATTSTTLQKTTARAASTGRKSAPKSSLASKHANSTGTKSSAAPATTSQTVKIDTTKINMTLATMPYQQVLCENTTEVQSGTVLNATWLSKGKYTNTVYVRYGLDGYSAWNLPPGGTLPPFAGKKVKGDDGIQEPDAGYRMTFQTPVYAYQKGIKLSILLYDNQKNKSIVTYESPEIFVRSECVLAKKLDDEAIDESKDEEGDSTEEIEDADTDLPAAKAQKGMAFISPPAPSSTQAGRAVSLKVALPSLLVTLGLTVVLLSSYGT